MQITVMYKDKKFIICNKLTLQVYAPSPLLCRFICVFMFPLRLNVVPQIGHMCLLEPCDNLCCRN